MPLVPLPDLLASARDAGYGVGYFEAWDASSFEAVICAAEQERSPVIAGFGGMMLDGTWLDDGGVELLGAIGQAMARRASVPVALLLNETQTSEQAIRGIDAGFGAVMIDTHGWSHAAAVDAIADLARRAHSRGVAVEGELGTLPDATAGGTDASITSLTDPDEAARFVADTGVDCLAVSVGNVHLLTEGKATIDLDRLRAIRDAVEVPLVIHGGTGFPDDAIRAAVGAGAVKFNVGTALKRAYLDALRQAVTAQAPHEQDVHALVGSHKDSDVAVAGQRAMTGAVAAFMRLYGSSGRAR